MMRSEFTCSACGSKNLRRSHSTSLLDLPKMAMGIYPFRCLDCKERFWINVWLFSRSKHAMCPRCLSLDVALAAPQLMRLSLWKKLRLTLGARGYRCSACGFRFLSSKPVQAHKTPNGNHVPVPGDQPEIASSVGAGK